MTYEKVFKTTNGFKVKLECNAIFQDKRYQN